MNLVRVDCKLAFSTIRHSPQVFPLQETSPVIETNDNNTIIQVKAQASWANFIQYTAYRSAPFVH